MCTSHDSGTSVKPRRTIDAKTILPMGSFRSAASQNAAPTRSMTGNAPPGSLILSRLIECSCKMDAGLLTMTSGPSNTFRLMLATCWLSVERRTPSRVKVHGSLVELLRFLSAFARCCLLLSMSRGKPGWASNFK